VSQSRSKETPKVEAPHVPLGDVHRLRHLRLAMWCVAFAVGAAHVWINRRNMCDIDGISYVEIGEAFLRGDWVHAINGLWSPLYGLLIAAPLRLFQPSPEHEIYIFQLVNTLVYAGTLTALDFLLRQIIEAKGILYQRDTAGETTPLPAWGVIALGYALFAWAAAYWFFLWLVVPDVLLAAFFFFATGIVVRIRTRGASWRRFIALGLVLGVGYLVKTVMFPLALVFLAVAALATDVLRRNARYAAVGALVFALIAAPLSVAISARVGRPTFGEAGRLNYLWNVDGITPWRFWRGEPPGSGTPKHPVRLVSQSPRIYEFATPVGGTYPLWYDPSYWYAGASPHLDIRKQIWRLEQSAWVYADEFLYSFQPLLLGGLLVLCFMGGRAAGRAALSSLLQQWPLWGPSVAGLAFYAAVWVEMRYVAAFLVILWLSLLAAARIPGGAGSQRRNVLAVVSLIAVVLIPTVICTARDLAYEKLNPDNDSAVQWQDAEAMRRLGIGPGDPVGVIGDGFFNGTRWAHLARVRIIAELPDAVQFWNASPGERARVLAVFEKTGAKAVFTPNAPPWSSRAGWHTLGERNRAAFVFPTRSRDGE
jgi:hypothetical protein